MKIARELFVYTMYVIGCSVVIDKAVDKGFAMVDSYMQRRKQKASKQEAANA